MGVTEKRMNHLGSIVVYDVDLESGGPQSMEQSLKIICEESKATVAGFSFGGRYIIAGHDDGTVTQYDAEVWRSPLPSAVDIVLTR